MAATRPPFFFWLHLNLRRVVEVVGRDTDNLNIPLSDQLAAGRKEYILLNDRVLTTLFVVTAIVPPLRYRMLSQTE